MKRVKKIGISSLILTLLAMSVGSVSVSAADHKDTTTHGKVEFIVDEEGVTETLDPEKPDSTKPIEPPENGGSTTGALRLDYVSNLDFGKNKISHKTQDYYAVFESGKYKDGGEIEYPSFFQVTDARGGTKGWEVSISNDGVFKEVRGNRSFEKATITLSNIGVKSGSNITNIDEFPVCTTGEIKITSNSVTLVTASGTKKQGYGTWTFPIGTITEKTTGLGPEGNDTTGKYTKVDETKAGRNPAVKLTIPAGAVVEAGVEYSTDLIWQLQDTY